MGGVAELVDRVVGLPPGPELAAALAAVPWGKVPNSRLVEVLQARSRQLAHEQAELFAGLVEISHAVAVADLPDGRDGAVARVAEHMVWASHEIAAGLTWTPTAADRELTLATALVERLPLVFAALRQGLIDRGRAWVFADYLDPATGDVTVEQSRALCERFVPLAPGLTTRQLADRLYRALHAIDPDLRRRRYRRAVRERGVALFLDPRTGTATLVGAGLPPDEAAAATQRLDRLVQAAKRAGHPGQRAQISADAYLGMLNGAFHGLTEAEIIGRLLATHRPEDHADAAGPGETADDDTGTPRAVGAPVATGAAGEAGTTGGAGAPPPAEDADRWAGDRVAVREGIEIRAGLATLAGRDDRPGEIPGFGPVAADVARTAAAAQRRGAAWRFAIVDTTGHLLLAGPLRRRPADRWAGPGRVRGGVVELHLTVDELRRYAADPALGDWHGVLAEIADAWADRDRMRRRLAAHPRARFARGRLADHVRIRDRHCCGPGCTRPARRSDLDHTLEHARGGHTLESNIGPACARHHPDKDHGWTLTQPEPGLFRWVSPLGRTYLVRGEPIRPDLPDPDGTDAPAGARDPCRDARIEDRPDEDGPPPEPEPPPDDGAPPS